MLIRFFSMFAKIKVFKFVKSHAIMSSFYIIATNIQSQNVNAKLVLHWDHKEYSDIVEEVWIKTDEVETRDMKNADRTNLRSCVRKISRAYVIRFSHAEVCSSSTELLFNSSVTRIWAQSKIDISIFSLPLSSSFLLCSWCAVISTFIFRLTVNSSK